jgi:hypothetical protein
VVAGSGAIELALSAWEDSGYMHVSAATWASGSPRVTATDHCSPPPMARQYPGRLFGGRVGSSAFSSAARTCLGS